MRKTNKILLILSGICAGVGVVLLLVGFMMGVSKHQILSSLSVTAADFGNRVEKMVTSELEDIPNSDWENLDMNEWRIEQYSDIKKMDINIGIGQLDIQEYDGETIQVFVRKGDERTEVKQSDSELKIQQKDGVHFAFEDEFRPVKIVVPKNQIFEKVDIEIGAGEGSITSIKTDEFKAEVGAGSLEVTDTVQAVESEWSVGAGSLDLNHLISRKTDLECAVGEMNVTLDGSENDYRMKGDIGVGSLIFGGTEWNSIGQKVDAGNDSAEKRITVDCGTGEVNVDFTE